MKKIAELLFQTYENSRKDSVYSQEYGNAIDALCKSLNKEQRQKLLKFETEIFETLALRSVDVILYMLELIHPEE